MYSLRAVNFLVINQHAFLQLLHFLYLVTKSSLVYCLERIIKIEKNQLG